MVDALARRPLDLLQTAGHHAPISFCTMGQKERIQTDSMLGRLGAVWGIGGVVLLLGYSIARLSAVTLEAFHHEFSWYHWLALGLNVIYMAYSEGYYGFQRGFAPRVAARAKYLAAHPTLLSALLAPVFCMGYFHIRRPPTDVHLRPHRHDRPLYPCPSLSGSAVARHC